MRTVFGTNRLLDQFFKYFSADVSLKKYAMHNIVIELKKNIPARLFRHKDY